MKRTKTRNILAWILALCMTLPCFPISVLADSETEPLQAATDVEISVESTFAEAASVVDVNISISGNPGIVGCELGLRYDDKLTLTSAHSGEAFSRLSMTQPGEFASPCKFIWDGGEFSEADVKDGVILTLTFAVSGSAVADNVLPVDVVAFEGYSYRNLEEPVSAKVSNGAVTVTGNYGAAMILSASGRISGSRADITIVSAEDYNGAVLLLAGYSSSGRMEDIKKQEPKLVKGENTFAFSDLNSALSYAAFLLDENMSPLYEEIPVDRLARRASLAPGAALMSVDAGNPALSIDKVSARPGDTVSVNVRITDNPGILGAVLTMSYDDSSMRLTKATSGAAFQALSFEKSGSMASPCSFSWDATGLSDAEITDGVILTLEFEISSSAVVPSTLPVKASYTANNVIDRQRNPVALKLTQGAVTVVDYIPGDVNEDQAVRINDVVLIRRHILGGYDISIHTDAADVNADGEVDINDVILVRQYIVGGYGVELLPSGVPCSHELEEIPYKAATETEDGNIRYWHCTICGKYFSDAAGTQEISYEDTVIKATGLEPGKHRVTYDIANGDPYLQGLVTDGTIKNPNPDTFDENSGLLLVDMKVEGYQFLGWFNGSGDNAAQIRNIQSGTENDVHLYAHWKEIEYTVQFKSSLLLEQNESTYTVRRGLVLPTPKLSSYVFTGWSDEDGKLYDGAVIPAGTTGDITLTANWTSERNKTYTKPRLDAPLIYEDEENDAILFVYEIGEIQNVPLYTMVDFGRILGDGITETRESTYTETVSKSLMDAFTRSVSNATTESSSWTLSDEWSESTSIDQEWCEEHGYTRQEAESVAKSDTGTWNISSGRSGSTDTTHVDTNQKNWENQVKINSSTESTAKSTESASLSASLSAQAPGIQARVSASLRVEDEYSQTEKSGFEAGGTTGNLDISTDTTTSSAGWNSSASFGGSKTRSETRETSVALSELINEKYHYGDAYTKSGASSEMKGFASTTSSEDSYSSSVTYINQTSETKKETFTTTSAKSGYYRRVMAGTAHVFAVVGYDLSADSFFVYTYSVMDDETHPFWDYSATTGSYNDMENGVIPFEVPYDLVEYVSDLTSGSAGLRVDQQTGTITGYTGTDNCVVIPEYLRLEDGAVIKITGISERAFQNNQDIVAVVLSDYITKIPDNAFSGCTSLVGITGGAVTEIGKNAFSGCTSIVDAGVNNKITKLGDNAFNGAGRLLISAANASVAEAAVKSGAKQVVLHLSYLKDNEYDLKGKTFAVPEGTEYFEFNGYGAAYEDFSLVSNADKTAIKEANFHSSEGIPLKLSSPEVTMNNVTASASGIAVVLSAAKTNLGLQGSVAVSSTNGNAMLIKNMDRYDLTKNVDGYLKISGVLLVCGTYTDDEYITYDSLRKINDEAFEKLLHSYTLTFDAQGGECEIGSREVANSTAIGELPTPRKTHYGFTGWYLGDGVTPVTANTVFDDGVNRTIYAHWEPNKCNLYFDANGGSCDEAVRMITLTAQIGELPATSRAGYTFGGWYLTDGTRLTSATVFTDEIDQIATAQWTPNTYTVSFDGNGGSPSFNSAAVTYNTGYGTLPSAARTGYTFSGWYTSASGGSRVYASTNISTASNHTLYAYWDIVKVEIPNFTGWYLSDVKTWCNNHGVSYSQSRAYDWKVAKDYIRSNSHSGSTVNWGSTTITLYVSDGAKPIAVGDTVFVDSSTRYWSQASGRGSSGYFTSGKTGTVKYISAGAACPYNIDGTGWVSASAVHQRTN